MKRYRGVMVGLVALAMIWGLPLQAAQAAESAPASEAQVVCPQCKAVAVTKRITDKVKRRSMVHRCPTCKTEWKVSEAEGLSESEQMHVCETCGAAVEQCPVCQAQS